MAIQFKAATKEQLKLRMALVGPAGSGKTYTALNIAQHLGKRIAVIDTEHGSASKYAGLFRFDTVEPESFHPQMYIDGITAAEQAGYDVLIIDSLSHAWMGKDGELELVDRAAKRSQSGSSFSAWRDVTPLHNQLVEKMLAAKLHLLVTMRTKTDYVQEKNDKGKTVIRKVGLAPVQKDGLEYEFDVVGDLDIDNNLIVGKTRCPALAGALIAKPGKEIADALMAWLTDGAPATPKPEPQQAAQPAPKAETSAPQPERKETPTQSGNVITEIQRKALIKMAKDGNITSEDFRRYLSEVHGVGNSKDLTQVQFVDVKSWLENGGKPESIPFADPAVPQEQQTFGDIGSPL